jgi:uncharacterized protein
LRIVNKTRDCCLASRAKEAVSIWGRMKGLLGRSSLEEGEGLFLIPCSSIHSLFMRFAFDAIFVDAEGKALHLIRRMKPWRVSKLVWNAAGVIELPAGVIEKTGTEVGDQILFEK